MAQATNTFDSYDSNRNRETFIDDIISRITPDETPFRSLIGTESVDGVHPEWETDALASPDTNNAFVQGDTYAFNAITPTVRVGSYTQIARKTFIVAETQEAVKKVGPKSEYNREMLKKGVELKIDQEVTLLSNQASLPGDSSTPARLGGLRAWLSTNDLMGATGASGGYNQGTKVVDAATNGTQRAFTKTLLDTGIQTVYNSGGNPTILMLSPYAKTVFSTFMSDANVAQQRMTASKSDQATIVGAADTYLSDFGTISVIPNRQMAKAGAGIARNAFLIERGKLKLGVLRPIQEDKNVAKTGDALPGVIKTEYTLIVRNEAACGVIADIFGMTVST